MRERERGGGRRRERKRLLKHFDEKRFLNNFQAFFHKQTRFSYKNSAQTLNQEINLNKIKFMHKIKIQIYVIFKTHFSSHWDNFLLKEFVLKPANFFKFEYLKFPTR